MNYHILIVEDDRHYAAWLGAILVGAGYTVSAASDIEEAKRYLKKEEPALVILDLRLNGDGNQFLAYLNQKAPALKVIILTAYPELLRAEAASNVAALFLKSSLHPAALIRELEQALRSDGPLGREPPAALATLYKALEIRRNNLAQLEVQRARFTELNVPPYLLNAIAAERAEIERLERDLSEKNFGNNSGAIMTIILNELMLQGQRLTEHESCLAHIQGDVRVLTDGFIELKQAFFELRGKLL